MLINFYEITTNSVHTKHDIDPEEFIEWLDGDEPTEAALKEYIYENWNPEGISEDYYIDTTECGFEDKLQVHEFLNECKN